MTDNERRKLEKKSAELDRQLASLSSSKDAIDAQLESATGDAVDGLRAEITGQLDVFEKALLTGLTVSDEHIEALTARVAVLEQASAASPALLPAVVPEEESL